MSDSQVPGGKSIEDVFYFCRFKRIDGKEVAIDVDVKANLVQRPRITIYLSPGLYVVKNYRLTLIFMSSGWQRLLFQLSRVASLLDFASFWQNNYYLSWPKIILLKTLIQKFKYCLECSHNTFFLVL